ncbi:hypothetical protein DENSPDRAFT_885111 [Dentipellis sp. KUC8613]|nr:hypothetical protein DENSPDRAFT_885111 [Dentipellis sp. KUC8613]
MYALSLQRPSPASVSSSRIFRALSSRQRGGLRLRAARTQTRNSKCTRNIPKNGAYTPPLTSFIGPVIAQTAAASTHALPPHASATFSSASPLSSDIPNITGSRAFNSFSARRPPPAAREALNASARGATAHL